MENEIYNVFRKSFDDINLSQDEFLNSVDYKNSSLEIEKADDDIVGFALSNHDTISLICVLPEYRNKGIGSKLLSKAEKTIMDKKYHQINVGNAEKYSNMFVGIPTNTEASKFFYNRGYDDEFFAKDYELDVKQIKSKFEMNDDITIVNNSDHEFMSLLMQYLFVKDKNTFEKYDGDEDINFLVAKKNNITGICAYTTDYNDINPGICVYDLISYPSFDVDSKKALLLGISDIALKNGYSKITVKNTTNSPLLTNCSGKEITKYWKGSKSIG